MSQLHYISHPNVAIDPTSPVPEWGLSDEGRRRAQAMLSQPWVTSTTRIVSSTETKAIETAEILAVHLGRGVEVRPGTGEKDRRTTGFVPPEEFELLADAFFADPHTSARGWERAIDAQQRIVEGLEDLLTPGEEGRDIAVIGHGGVGTLWYCHLVGVPINRGHDQPGQGHFYTIDLTTRAVLHTWRPIDALPS